MFQATILTSVTELAKEFERCCREYDSLQFATAWCGDPRHVLPYAHLEAFAGKISATVGRHFDHTHPDAIELLLKRKANLRVFRKERGLFHPKLYLFSSGERTAVFLGSSNLTHSGFYQNVEVNVLLEGIPNAAETAQLKRLQEQVALWRSHEFSFKPDGAWVASYRKDYAKALRADKRAGIKTPREYESEISNASWLAKATWKTYYSKILEGLEQNAHDAADYVQVLDKARETLRLPWKATYFDDLEARKIIGGMKPYGSLGHVAASGRFRRLLAHGTPKEKRVIVDVINEIGSLKPHVDWNRVGKLLERLVHLGPTMKVWSRVLCLVRPDLFCTVSSMSVRTNLSQTLKVPQSRFESPKGYVALLRLIHMAPWLQSAKPTNEQELRVWKSRAAFMDAIFYS